MAKRICGLLAAALLIGQAQVVRAGPLQDQYNSAQAAFDAGRMGEARSGFAALLPQLDANPKAAAQAAVVRSRLGAAHLALGDDEVAAALLTRAVATLPEGSDEWQDALIDLGHAAEEGIDYPAAAGVYRQLLLRPDVQPLRRLAATSGMVRALMFSDPATARRYADDALGQAVALHDKSAKDTVAALQMLRGRIELNDGKPGAAYIWLKRALESAGGLGVRVNLTDVRVRGDLAMATFLDHHPEEARRYLAYTGAGQLPEQGLEFGADMPLPACAPVGPVARDDMAVVEFTIADDGRVTNVNTVYATRTGGPELAFARAVRNWSWRPDAVAKLPLFWRQAVRMELRCVSRGPGRNADWSLGPAVLAWLAEHAPEPMPVALRGEAAALPMLRAELARRTAAFGAQSPQLLPVLFRIATNEAVTGAERAATDRAGMALATATGAPADFGLLFRIDLAELDLKPKTGIAALIALLKAFDAEGVGQTRAAAVAAVHLGTYAAWADQPAMMDSAYRRILAMPMTTVADGDPLRQTARLQLASLAAAAANVDAAHALLAETGLTADQCSAFPIEPAIAANGIGSSAFPREALEWHFEGNVRIAYDLDPAGKPQGVRIVTATPPLVFNDASKDAAQHLRYRPIYREGAAIACADMEKGIRYRIR